MFPVVLAISAWLLVLSGAHEEVCDAESCAVISSSMLAHRATRRSGGKCAQFEDRSTNGAAIVSGAGGIASGGAGYASAVKDMAKFTTGFAKVAGGFGVLGGVTSIAGELFFDDPNEKRIDALEDAVVCVEEKLDALKTQMDRFAKDVKAEFEQVHGNIERNLKHLLENDLRDAISEIETFVQESAESFIAHPCVVQDMKGHKSLLFRTCNSDALFTLVSSYQRTSKAEWKRFWAKVDQVGKADIPKDKKRMFFAGIAEAAASGLQVAGLAYSVTASWAVNICEWRYKKYEQKNSIPMDYNPLCFKNPADEHYASRRLDDIVEMAQASLVEIANQARIWVRSFDQHCTIHSKCPMYRSTVAKEWTDLSDENMAKKLRSGCCKRKTPFDVGGRYYPNRGDKGENEQAAKLLDLIRLSLSPAFPYQIREKDLRNIHHFWGIFNQALSGGGSGYSGFGGFGGHGGGYGGYRFSPMIR